MSEVTDAPTRSETTTKPRPLQGSNVWYELMTTDPDGATAFYGSVVGWKISESIPGDQDYRMIGRSDGGFAGGVLGLTDEMRQHGARPIWLGYIGVDDVDATLYNARVGVEFYPWTNFGVVTQYSYNKIEASVDRTNFLGNADIKFSGLQVLLKARF